MAPVACTCISLLYHLYHFCRAGAFDATRGCKLHEWRNAHHLVLQTPDTPSFCPLLVFCVFVGPKWVTLGLKPF